MKTDTIVGGLLFALTSVYLIQRNLVHMVAWLALIYLVATQGGMSHTISVLAGIVGIYVICMVTAKTWEHFENDEKEKESKEKPEPAPPKTDTPHVDIGTTILHAYRNLSPEQIGGMRRDTKELMSLQKELMGSLSEMKPAIEQGAELLKTFSTFFGKDGMSMPGAEQ
jgi:hypothetical protein